MKFLNTGNRLRPIRPATGTATENSTTSDDAVPASYESSNPIQKKRKGGSVRDMLGANLAFVITPGTSNTLFSCPPAAAVNSWVPQLTMPKNLVRIMPRSTTRSDPYGFMFCPEAITPSLAGEAVRALIDQARANSTLPHATDVSPTTSSEPEAVEAMETDCGEAPPVTLQANIGQELASQTCEMPIKTEMVPVSSQNSSPKSATKNDPVSFAAFSFQQIRLPGGTPTQPETQKMSNQTPSGHSSRPRTLTKSSERSQRANASPQRSKSPVFVSRFSLARGAGHSTKRLSGDAVATQDEGHLQKSKTNASPSPTVTTAKPKDKTPGSQAKTFTPRQSQQRAESSTLERSDTKPATSQSAKPATGQPEVVSGHKTTPGGLMREALKLTYLNSLGFIDDSCFEFMARSMLSALSVPGADFGAKKRKLNEMLVNQIDKQILLNLSKSGLYSLILQADADFTLIYVFVRFTDTRHFKSTADRADRNQVQQTRLVKLLSMPLGGSEASDSQIKWSKSLTDQIAKNVIEPLALNKNNLMCISLDTRLLDRVNLSAFHSSAKARLHPSVLVVPNSLVSGALGKRLGQWSFGDKFSTVSYFETLRALFHYLKLTKSALLTGGGDDALVVIEFENLTSQLDLASLFRCSNLERLRNSLDSVYANYSEIVTFLQVQCKTSDRLALDLRSKLDSIEYYFMTCLLCDYARFAVNYQLNWLRYGSTKVQNHLPWNFMGSYVHNLLNVQLVDTAAPGDRAARNPIVFDEDRVHKLNQVKKNFERTVASVLDTCLSSQQYETLVTTEKDTVTSALAIYSTLVKMFDITYDQIEKVHRLDAGEANLAADYKLSLNHSLTVYEMKCLLAFYELGDVVTIQQAEAEYSRFWRLFFEKMPSELRLEVEQELSAHKLEQRQAVESGAALAESTVVRPGSKLGAYFARFVWENTSQRVCAITSFLASIFQCLPAMVDFRELKQTDSFTNMSDLEKHLKVLYSFDSATQHIQTTQSRFEDLVLVNFDEIEV